ncbi:MAG TPA: 30S ribosomal protein S20 [Patescibacteria group bacterium]|nr:30S ribosomal protein S20 [Patescibacteria group bacterium]
MAITKSGKKRIRRNARRQVLNKSRVSEMRGSIRKIDEAVKAGDEKAAQAALKAAQPKMARTAQKGIISKKTISRKISRLSARIKKMGAKK